MTSVAVVAAPRHVAQAGAVAALELARSASAPCAVVCVWGADLAPAARLVGAPAAARLAAGLQRRDIDASASGRLVRVLLADDPAAAVRAIRRAAAVSPVPVVLALGGRRPPELDLLIAEQDVVEVAVADDDVALLAVHGLGRRAPTVTRRAVPPAIAGRLALLGLAAWA